MINIKFDINKYVDECFPVEDEKQLDSDLYDCLPEKKETMKKNVKHFLDLFGEDGINLNFSFDRNVFEYFPIHSFDNKEIGSLIDHIFNIKGGDDKIGNKIISNLSKISVDSKNNHDNHSKWRTYDFLYLHEPIKGSFPNHVEYYKEHNRMIIRKTPIKVKTLIDDMVLTLLNLKKSNIINDLEYIIDYVSDSLLQALNYWLFTFEDLTYDKKMIIADNVDKYLENFEKKVNNILKNRNLNITLEDTMSIFISFLVTRNEFGEYMRIIDTLEEEQEKESSLFGLPIPEYRLQKKDVISQDKMKGIITEGRKIDRFNEKLENTKETIRIFSKYGGRNVSDDCALDIKVFFREIYISNTKYKRKALTIVRKCLEVFNDNKSMDSFELSSEYMFLREKINRGYFRETNDLRLYNRKNRIQYNLDKVLLKIILLYDYTESIDLLVLLTKELLPICFSGIDYLLEKNYRTRIF